MVVMFVSVKLQTNLFSRYETAFLPIHCESTFQIYVCTVPMLYLARISHINALTAQTHITNISLGGVVVS